MSLFIFWYVSTLIALLLTVNTLMVGPCGYGDQSSLMPYNIILWTGMYINSRRKTQSEGQEAESEGKKKNIWSEEKNVAPYGGVREGVPILGQDCRFPLANSDMDTPFQH